MAILDNVKTMLGITDTVEDAKLTIIINNTTSRLRNFIDRVEYPTIPEELNYIIEEVTIKRYNRIGSEGMQSESVEGRSATYQINDFDEYLDVLSDYNLGVSTRGKVTFY